MTIGPLLACLVLLLGPGVGGALAAYRPGEIGLPVRVALIFAFACVIPAVIGLLLAVGGVLSPIPLLVLVGVATGALWYVGLAKGRGREHVTAVRAALRDAPWPLGVGLAVVAAIAALHLTVSPLLHFSYSSSWRYWADAVEVADGGRIPDLVLHYGTALPAVVNKALVNTLGAGLSFVIGREPLPGMAAMLWLSSAGLAAALWAFAHELGLRLTAPLVPLLVMTNRLFLNEEITVDLYSFKAETFGRMVSFVAVAVGIRAIRDWRRKDAFVSGGLLGLAAGMHAVPVLIAAGFLVFYAAGRLLVDRGVVRLAGRTALIGAVAAVVGGVVLFVPRGDIAIAGASDAAQSARTFDPTRYLNSGQRVPIGEANRWYIGPRRVLNAYVGSATGVSTRPAVTRWVTIGLAVAGLLAVAAMVLWAPAAIRPVGLAALGLATLIVGATWVLSARYRLYIPAFFGVRRLFDYSSIPLVLTGLALIEWAILALPVMNSRSAMVAALVVAVAAVLLIPSARPPGTSTANRAAADAFSFVRTRLPCDARILPDVHTEGAFEALTGRVSILEGPTPYLRPAVRDTVIRLFLEAHRFFRRPAENRSFLERQGVDYVALMRNVGVGYHGPIGAGSRAELDRTRFLRLVHASPSMDVYEVVGREEHDMQPYPPPAAFPGYRCQRAPIDL